MRALIQRVTYGSVHIDKKLKGEVKNGLVVLLGVQEGDTEKDFDYLCRKVPNLRIFTDDADKMNLSLLDIDGEMLIISQFTLMANTRKGNRPGFTNSAAPEEANAFYEKFIQSMERLNIKVASGEFGADMQVTIHNDGPVTILIDSRDEN